MEKGIMGAKVSEHLNAKVYLNEASLTSISFSG